MSTSITRRPPDDTAQRIAGAKACIAALAKLEKVATLPADASDDYRAALKRIDDSAAAMAVQFGPLTARQEGAFRTLVEYIDYVMSTGQPNLERWVPVVGMTPEELEADIKEEQERQTAMYGPGGSMVTGSSQEDSAPAPIATERTPFSKFSGKDIFTVADGIPVADALEHASYFLSLAESLLTCDPDELEGDQVLSARHMIEMGKALVDASSGRA